MLNLSRLEVNADMRKNLHFKLLSEAMQVVQDGYCWGGEPCRLSAISRYTKIESYVLHFHKCLWSADNKQR